MKKLIFLLFLIFLLVGCCGGNVLVPTQQIEIKKVSPQEGVAGRLVKMDVTGDINDQILVILESEKPVVFEPKEVTKEVIWFEIPKIKPGNYKVGLILKGEYVFWSGMFFVEETVINDGIISLAN